MKATDIPHKSRDIVGARAMGRCERCGMNGAHWHHRRSRRIRDKHVHCPCNGVLLCSSCHVHVHAKPTESQDSGMIVSSYVDEPFGVPFRRWDGALVKPLCNGDFVFVLDD